MADARAWSATSDGIDGVVVEAAADLGTSRPDVTPVGPLASTETRERVRAAVRNSDLPWPNEQVTLRVSPVASAAAGDLALACAVLAAAGAVPAERLATTLLLGELGLDGRVRPVRGVLPALLAARRAGLPRAVVPAAVLPEAALVSSIQVLGVQRLSDVVGWLRGVDGHVVEPGPPSGVPQPHDDADLAEVVGQPEAVEALEVAAAGAHHLLLIGAPGSGTSMLAHRLPGLLPPLSHAQALQVTALHSLAGTLSPVHPLITRPPLQAPHHSASMPALLGGGQVLRPGAISLAHHGVLFLDQLAEFGPQRLESLRTALDVGEICLTRRDRVTRFPARVLLVAATAPCPCAAVAPQPCTCTPTAKQRYLARIPGALLDRIDLRVRLRPTRPSRVAAPSSAVVSERVMRARQRAADRWAAHGFGTNAEVPTTVLRSPAFRLPRSVTDPVERALDAGALSARGADRALRVSWTLADLAGLDQPGPDQIAEAMAFRDRRPERPGALEAPASAERLAGGSDGSGHDAPGQHCRTG